MNDQELLAQLLTVPTAATVNEATNFANQLACWYAAVKRALEARAAVLVLVEQEPELSGPVNTFLEGL